MNLKAIATLAVFAVATMGAGSEQPHFSPATPARANHATGAPDAGAPTQLASAGRGHAVKVSPVQLAQQETALTTARAGDTTNAEAALTSGNWSGQIGGGTYQGLSGGWRVPSVQATTANKYSCTWIGLDGWSGDSALIQTGTEEDSYAGRPRYYAWFELIPQTQTQITYSNGSLVPVAAGDSMWSYIYKPNANSNAWSIYLQDKTQGWSFATTVNYAASGASVEWIHEATKVNNQIGPPPVFSRVTFTSLEYLSGTTWYYTRLSAANEINLVQNNVEYARAGAPTTSSPQSFGITFG